MINDEMVKRFAAAFYRDRQTYSPDDVRRGLEAALSSRPASADVEAMCARLMRGVVTVAPKPPTAEWMQIAPVMDRPPAVATASVEFDLGATARLMVEAAAMLRALDARVTEAEGIAAIDAALSARQGGGE